MRLAVFSDIHGNSIALDAVVEDVQRQGGVDGWLVLGDLVAQGYDPIGVAERLNWLPKTTILRGNTDRYVWSRELPHWVTPERLESQIAAIQSHAWTHGCLSSAGMLDWLKALPLDQRFELPDGTRVLCVHAAPGKDDGAQIDPSQSDEAIAAMLEGCEADLVLTGHSHWPSQRRVAGVHAVNVSSVSNPLAPDLRAAYTLLEADASGYKVTQHRVAYDLEHVIYAIKSSDFFPNPEWLVAWFEGKVLPAWERPGYRGSVYL